MTDTFNNTLNSLIALEVEYRATSAQVFETNRPLSRALENCAADIALILKNYFGYDVVDGRGINDESAKSTLGNRSTIIENLK